MAVIVGAGNHDTAVAVCLVQHCGELGIPYGNTKGLRVAVASLDKGTRIEQLDTTVNIGDMIISNLHEMTDWVAVVDEEQAVEGVRRGATMPASSFPRISARRRPVSFTSNVRKPTLQYYVNEKKNAIATKITDKGVSTIQQQVNESLISASSEALGKAFHVTCDTVEGKKEDLADEMVASMKDARNDLVLMGSSVNALKSALTAGKGLLSSVQAMLPDSRELLESGQDTGADIKPSNPFLRGFIGYHDGQRGECSGYNRRADGLG